MTLSGYIFLIMLIMLPLVLYRLNTPDMFQKHSIAFISALIVYIFIVSYTFYLNYQFENELYAFDLNDDGSFSEEECTPLCNKAMENFVQDTGRNFAPFTGFIFSFVYYFLIRLTSFIIQKISRRKKI